jgi:putative transposase
VASESLRSEETEAMKRSKFTEEQILFALKQADAGQPVGDICRQMGNSDATFYVWKKRYGNLGLLEVRELRPLRD